MVFRDNSGGHSPERPRVVYDDVVQCDKCTDCKIEFYDSVLRKQFGVLVCDCCRRANVEVQTSLIDDIIKL